MSDKEYRLASAAHGGLLYMRGVPGVALGDRVVVRDHSGRRRNGQVIRTSDELVLIQMLEGTDNLDLERTWVRFLDQPFEVALNPDILGRVFNGLGQPRDSRPPMYSKLKRNVNGAPVNPAARAYPREFIQTGLSAVDGLNSLVRGQKLPISHEEVIATGARASARFTQLLRGVLRNVVMFLNLADEPTIERLILPRAALTVAEYLAFDLDMHVLVVMTDMTHYAEALREVATAKGDVPARKGYPGYLYSDLAEIYERAGRIRGKRGSITMVPVVSMPSDDITHPIPDLTGYITEGQLVLSRTLNNLGIYPPVDIPPSLSRLMKDGIGKDHTREDHARVTGQLYASYARALEVRNLASIIGADDLSETDQNYLAFAGAFEQHFVGQGEHEDRSIVETLNLAWDLLSMLPPETLTRVGEADLVKYHHWQSAAGKPE